MDHELLVKYVLSRSYLPSLKRMAIRSLRDEHDVVLLDGAMTLFYIESDISPFAASMATVYGECDLYLSNVFDRRVRALCKGVHSVGNAAGIESLCAIPSMVPTFWMMQPVINLFKHSMPTQSVTHCLHFMFILSRCPQHHYWHNVAPWDLYRTLCTLFLCDSNLWGDATVNALAARLMQQCWRRIVAAEDVTGHKVSGPGKEWEEFYTKLVERFETDSMGDDLFSKVVLFQAQNGWSCNKKRFQVVLWSQMDSLGVLLKRQCPPNLRSNDGWKAYFVPFVADSAILDHMLQALVSSTFAGQCRHSFLYFVAIAQIAHCIWERAHDGKVHLNMLQSVLSRCAETVAVDVLNCRGAEHIEATSLDAGVQDENEVEMLTLTLLGQTLNIGKADVVRTKLNRNRIALMKRDFPHFAFKMKL